MTTTALQAALSVGGTAGVVGGTKTTAQSSTTAYIISAQVTAGAGLPFPAPRTPTRVYYTSSPFSYTAGAQAAARLSPTARYFDLPIPAAGSEVLAKDGTLEVLTGQYIYMWIETEKFTNPITVAVSLQEP